MTLFLGSLQLGLMYGLLAMGIFISFRILNVPDLTAEGSFTLGVAVSAMVTVAGAPYLGLLLALLCGMVAGAVTGALQTGLGIHPILAGILTMSGLYTVNLAIMGASSNVSLIGKQTLFQQLYTLLAPLGKDGVKLLAGGMLTLLVLFALVWFFRTHLGLCIRATGDNEAMVRSSSINSSAMKIAGLAVSNGCIALCGAIVAQYQGYADITSGIGILVVGLASVIIGEAFFGRRSVTIGLVSAIVGSVIYRIIISLALSTNIFPTYFLKLVSAVIVAVALSIPAMKSGLVKRHARREGRSRA
jgi:putative tryptophan/tyrosine transport system permease protein